MRRKTDEENHAHGFSDYLGGRAFWLRAGVHRHQASIGVLPVAILGTDEFDVADVNTASIKLLLLNEDPMVEIEVEAIADKMDYNDVSTPLEEQVDCNCAETGPDGYTDLVIYFDSQELATAIEDFEVAAGITLLDMEDLPLALVAELWGNTDPDMYDIGGYDCIRILKKGNRD
jgi:hypothetical protein